MTNGNAAAFNFDPEIFNLDSPLTKREYFAAMAMQALFPTVNVHTDKAECAEDAVEMADALIAELNRETKGEK